MSDLYVEQESVPEVTPRDEVMFLFRSHGSATARAYLWVTALTSDAAFETRSGKTLHADGFTSTTSTTFNQVGQRERIELPIGGDIHDLVTVLRVTQGKVSVAVTSPIRVQTEFRSLAR